MDVIFKHGDWVKTSKGNVGIVLVGAHYEIGYYNEEKVWVGERVVPASYNIAEQLKIAKADFSNPDLTFIVINNVVRLGKKESVIATEKLTKVDKLYVSIQQAGAVFTMFLPVEDAKIIMDLYDRNDIWYSYHA